MRLCIVAGEASGDLHASAVVHELRKLDPDIEMFGFGGDLLAAEGMTILHHVSELGIVGLFNVLRHLSMFRRVFDQLLSEIARQRPDAVLLVDYPDFNLRVARRCRGLGIPVIYYISPQVWAWRKGRVAQIARFVDHMIVIFPFEEELYRRHGVPVTYVGHPLVEQLAPIAAAAFDIPDSVVHLALLPGSRRSEVDELLPRMLDAVAILSRELLVRPFIVRAPTIQAEQIEQIVRQKGVSVPVIHERQREELAMADLALSSSGTATLESALLGVPVIVMYRLTTATYLAARWLVRLPHFSLVNIVAGKRVVPELLQGQVTGKRIAGEVRNLLDPERYAQVRGELDEVRRKLGETGASRRAAEKIYKLVTGSHRAVVNER
ncbi:MAG TPA: lipid-A-disaccharide synthase [Thermoanaerobaculia bacterium]|nr:lipid-A-disaccharide synthase [Thermoanaerobaculia bacterium]